jgi:hypothetical protein
MPSHPRSARRSRLLALAVLALLLAAVAFATTVASLASSAPATLTTTAPATTDVLPSVTTTAAATAATASYRPTLAGPPATDPNGQWIPDPAPAGPSAGGGR